MEISTKDFKELKALEEGLWQTEFRFDLAKMEQLLAPNFFEYGRSGRVYQREDTLAISTQEIPAVIPLVNFEARLIDINVVQITYISIVNYSEGKERALRSSIWLRTPKGWQLMFHQGTPIQE